MSVSCATHGTHATRVETYRRIRQHKQDGTTTDEHIASNRWTVWERDGTRLEYTPQRGDISDPAKTLRWVLTQTVDTHGNEVRYHYNCNTTGCELGTITYGEGKTCVPRPDCPVGTVLQGVVIRFYWEGRPDPVTVAQGGFLDAVDRRVHAIEIFDGGALVRIYNLDYQPEPAGLGGLRAPAVVAPIGATVRQRRAGRARRHCHERHIAPCGDVRGARVRSTRLHTRS